MRRCSFSSVIFWAVESSSYIRIARREFFVHFVPPFPFVPGFHHAGLNCPFQVEADVGHFNGMPPLRVHLELGELIHPGTKARFAFRLSSLACRLLLEQERDCFLDIHTHLQL